MSQASAEPEALTEHSEFEDDSSDNKNDKRGISSDPVVESQGESQQSNASIDQEFGCGICLDILTTPYTIIPCLHTFDKDCLIQWWKRNPICPTCKKESTSAKSAFQLKAIMNHVHKNRPKRRKLSPTASTSTDEIYPTSAVEGEDTWSDESENQDAPDVNQGDGLVWPCISCIPGNHTGYTCPMPLPTPTPEEIQAAEALHPNWAPIRAPLRGHIRTPLDSVIEDGLPGARDHSHCVGCKTYVPLGFPRVVRCGGCDDVYCHNLESADCPSGSTFVPRSDVKLTPHNVLTLTYFFPPLVKNNQREITRFIDYITARDLSLSDILVALFEAKHDQTAEDANEDAANEHWGADAWFCARCVNFVASLMFFGWWMNERKDSIERRDGLISTKPDCWYGRECRTQTHNDSHAERLNHICENTRTRN